MPCPDCDGDLVAFDVPADLREHAPATRTALCARCLRTHDAEAVAGDDDPEVDFSAVGDYFPDDRAGVALALALGRLGSLALERRSVQALCDEAERAGGDVMLTLDRLAGDSAVAPHFDLDRRRSQLADLL